ncbi:MAG TPA: 4-(cytidine 5'-diphospho)-2-C-methyl-D-erythritol kinase, partial [Afifellaceae bacterium]|nr:4-(cytidine 5'-diphospho)-2-C-methyl-D-erythritol kinase [Afifellaceae bacterium]
MFADLGDRLRVEPASGLSLNITGPFAGHAPPGPENLVLRVAGEIRRSCGGEPGADLLLEKNLPAGAGL